MNATLRTQIHAALVEFGKTAGAPGWETYLEDLEDPNAVARYLAGGVAGMVYLERCGVLRISYEDYFLALEVFAKAYILLREEAQKEKN